MPSDKLGHRLPAEDQRVIDQWSRLGGVRKPREVFRLAARVEPLFKGEADAWCHSAKLQHDVSSYLGWNRRVPDNGILDRIIDYRAIGADGEAPDVQIFRHCSQEARRTPGYQHDPYAGLAYPGQYSSGMW